MGLKVSYDFAQTQVSPDPLSEKLTPRVLGAERDDYALTASSQTRGGPRGPSRYRYRAALLLHRAAGATNDDRRWGICQVRPSLSPE
jgi:hypothetical protein